MPSTTIKVPVELRDRLAALAERDHTTLAGAIARTLDAAADHEFWQQVAQTMALARQNAEQYGATLSDGLDPGERWDDIL